MHNSHSIVKFAVYNRPVRICLKDEASTGHELVLRRLSLLKRVRVSLVPTSRRRVWACAINRYHAFSANHNLSRGLLKKMEGC